MTVPLVAAAVTSIVAVAANVALIRRVALPSRPKMIPLVINDSTVAIARSPLTSLAGEFGIWVNGGRGHLHVGELVSGEDTDLVYRRILRTFGDITDATAGRWSGHAFPHASSLGLKFHEVVLEAPSGRREAWVFPGNEKRWAIHVHGFKSTRASALRGVPVFGAKGFTSLVPAYYGESPIAVRNRSEGATFGVVEAPDIDVALKYAVDRGAKEIVLVGWSLGGEVALTLAERSPYRALISGAVLVGPVLNWRHSLAQGMHNASIPRWAQWCVLSSLESQVWSRFAQMKMPASFAAHDWTASDRRPAVPTLVLHSRGDQDTSWEDSETFAALNPEGVELTEFEPVPHLLEWNTQRRKLEMIISSWTDRLTAPRDLEHE